MGCQQYILYCYSPKGTKENFESSVYHLTDGIPTPPFSQGEETRNILVSAYPDKPIGRVLSATNVKSVRKVQTGHGTYHGLTGRKLLPA
jgi:hypothetical protein